MKREFLVTGDGSTTIHLPDWNEQYHSKHGAIAEAKHVFIEAGLQFYVAENPTPQISILEIGFGTGLNALVTYAESKKLGVDITYVGVEAYPVSHTEVEHLNYAGLTNISEAIFKTLHTAPWEENTKIASHFNLLKRKQFFSEISEQDSYNLIYFDAFGARVQPELWTEEIFEIMYKALRQAGVLVTYAAKGSVRRAMQAVGFTVERLPGPPGKREMLRATKST
ncbi:tRNA (5-methylaminomethyl-2-thiouridine)(34)-methyltransferase MnmD [Rasiella rasia]|uniref:tRNA (5-methylaminomethyl-2-thiouridine)(34)-methyltransferase MnmD n=1 Tax=Rasiella rasia TaxID=2744027 RepID=A0A6G6GPU2_9FLAO|nr:tRNA (5-methylaminomethyl-2-thiouridine)(34)-methyltransferase MnmD [Rasiella rasia]QIE60569.1 tRNA (5-methylaminomethyl-2-thiouridine)(34)-methyltransferase MnmD [Rasiella rasia]